MTRITLIAAIGRNLAIGQDGVLPWNLPADLRHFRSTTMGHPLVMGRRTFESIGRSLPGRRTIVITRSGDWHHAEVESAHTFPEALALAGPADEVFVVGGGEVYREAMPYAARMVLTEVDTSPEADTFFPEWVVDDWRETSREEHEGFAFATYERAGIR